MSVCVLLDYWNEDVGLDEMTGSAWQPGAGFPLRLFVAVLMAVGTGYLLMLFQVSKEKSIAQLALSVRTEASWSPDRPVYIHESGLLLRQEVHIHCSLS